MWADDAGMALPRKVAAAGGVAALGADQSSGPVAHRELELLVKAGIPNLQLIKIATQNGAKFVTVSAA